MNTSVEKNMKALQIAQPGTSERGAGGASAPPAFQWGRRGSKSALLKCNDLLSNC